MRPRTILYTGKGGVGKTSVAAATARRCAAAGARTLVISTDPAHSIADVLDAPVEGRPTEVGPRLHAQQVQAQDEMELHWGAVSEWMGGLLMERGTDRIAAEELTVPPGGDELFSLLVLKAHVESGEWDVIIVDCAPTGETLRLLSFPDAARWWLDKVLGKEQSMLNAARPLARMFLDVQLPDEKVIAEVQKLVGNLVAMHELLRDAARVSMRLVMTPDRMVVAEAMRTFTYLNLYGYLTDAVIVNRVFPDELAEGYFGAWHAVQREQLDLVGAGFSPVPILSAPYFATEVDRRRAPGRARRRAVRRPRPHRGPARPARPGAVDEQRQRHAAPGPAVRRQGRREAQEDRAGADRARGHAQAHDRAARRARGVQADECHARGRLADRGVRAWLSPTARPTRPPNGSCARPTPRPRRPRAPRRPARRRTVGRSPTGAPAVPDFAALFALVDAAKGTLPPELLRQVADALRELLIALRAVLDYSIDKLDRPAPEGRDVEDIPIS